MSDRSYGGVVMEWLWLHDREIYWDIVDRYTEWLNAEVEE